MDEIKKSLNSQLISELFGIKSKIYLQSIEFFKEQAKKQKSYEIKFKDWKKFFTQIYGYEISSELFLKHTYFVLLLKLLVFYKLSTHKNFNLKGNYEQYLAIDLKDLRIFEFEYFPWIKFNKELFNEIINQIQDIRYAKEQLFSNIYQELFRPDLRHKIGEFYTPSNLVQKMVEDIYIVGLKILDPSCGSGNFLINLVIKILDSSELIQLKSKAISNIYGFDINPLAIIATKTNMFLLILEYFDIENREIPKINIFLIDSLFPEIHEKEANMNIKSLYHSFDIVIGNPPWLTYKDIHMKGYQNKIRGLSQILGIKPASQYITHIELATIFFYAIPLNFLKKNGHVFFVMPKSVLNGDHCHKFRAFSIFSRNLEIWDFPNNYFFNVNHICLKAEYVGKNNSISIEERYPIKTKLFDDKLQLKEETFYSSLKIENDGTKLILPQQQLEFLNTLEQSPYKDKFFQGATIVPRTLIFFKKKEKREDYFIISSDSDVLSRAKKKWIFQFKDKEIEQIFKFKTFLNMDLIPFFIKRRRNIFLPVNEQFEFDLDFLQNYPKALSFYKEMNNVYQKNKKETSTINTLFENINYWNKLKKQVNNKSYVVVYNASGSNLKAAVIDNDNQKVIIGSENYYYSTDSENEAYYLSAVLNDPNLSKNIKLIKSSRHIHKRPFMFPIPLYNKSDLLHKQLAKIGKKCELLVYDLVMNNPSLNSEKVKTFLHQKLKKIQNLTEQVFFT
ncbi:MAG: N-6 DNA methylase [Candidatus Lokiarchaeia archaeon]